MNHETKYFDLKDHRLISDKKRGYVDTNINAIIGLQKRYGDFETTKTIIWRILHFISVKTTALNYTLSSWLNRGQPPPRAYLFAPIISLYSYAILTVLRAPVCKKIAAD